ncbi:hypothetical protein, conserved [Trypanosoma brucei brucei TREU927]|uniref:CHCH domain-containing protein n=1 Tax=Trypanosoma brucei brucei (strain 927/4 GUTat10.1) TaxID=185431 RepID=Q57VW7_TRYB2|nr:hypothetical protein, conserved [Trypanosoma brucei brucei TREU927]AAX70247.1 hypothetical protein, conserved [Trypanosoma brucei]AAZ11161.1 hypothetical protein, conserved [Trypanosoma brucei brucei TREU927]
MVVLKGGGTTYAVGNGRQMPWEEVPEGFKRRLAEQEEITPCVELRAIAQRCIEVEGFWAPNCVEATEQFHSCQAQHLAGCLPNWTHHNNNNINNNNNNNNNNSSDGNEGG